MPRRLTRTAGRNRRQQVTRPQRLPRTRRLRSRRIGAGAVFVVATLVAAQAGVAYFKTTGGATVPGQVGTTLAATLSVGTPTSALYPGGHGDVALTIDNPNPVAVHIGSLSLATGQGTAGYDVDAGHTGCATSALSFTTQAGGWTVPPKVGATDGTLPVDLTAALALSVGAANACQGATFNVYLTAGP